MKSLRDSEEAISKFEVAHFMVSLDTAEKNTAFAESLNGNFPLLADPKKQAAEAYGVLGLGGLYTKRWTFYIDKEGVIRYIDKSVSTKSAGADVAARLEALGFPRREEKPSP